MEHNHHHDQSVKADLLSTIRKGDVAMRPRWYFLLQTALAVMGAGFLLFGLFYTASVVVLLVRTSGALRVSDFGPEGWFAFLFMLPWMFVLGAVLFLFILESVLRRFAFAYRQPVLYSVALLLALAVVGAIVLDRMEMHQGIRAFSSAHGLTPVEGFYRTMDGRRPCCVVTGRIVENGATRILIERPDGTVTQVFFDARTRFPDGRSFATSNIVVLFGDGDDASVSAKGVRVIGSGPLR